MPVVVVIVAAESFVVNAILLLMVYSRNNSHYHYYDQPASMAEGPEVSTPNGSNSTNNLSAENDYKKTN